MSHYTVLVVGDDIEGQLAPYDENIIVEPYKNRISLEPVRRGSGGELIYRWPVCIAAEMGADVTDPHAVVAAYAEKFGADDDDRYDVDDEGLFQWSTYNPESKWDWYEVGGRWAGTFLLKPGADGTRGTQSWGWNQEGPNAAYQQHGFGEWVDSARKGDIDWGGMTIAFAKKARGTWWKMEAEPGDRWLYDIADGETQEQYIARQSRWQPYAVLAEGAWREPGRMGWWGISHAEGDAKAQFTEWWQDFFAKMPDDTLLTVVDCHI